MDRELPIDQIELSRRWGISHYTLERWRWAGIGPAYLKIGGRIRYRLVDVYAYEEKHLHNHEPVFIPPS